MGGVAADPCRGVEIDRAPTGSEDRRKAPRGQHGPQPTDVRRRVGRSDDTGGPSLPRGPLDGARADLGVPEVQDRAPDDARLPAATVHHRWDGTEVADGVQSALRSACPDSRCRRALGRQRSRVDVGHLSDNRSGARTKGGARKVDRVTDREARLRVRPPRVGHRRQTRSRGRWPVYRNRDGTPGQAVRRHIGCDDCGEQSPHHHDRTEPPAVHIIDNKPGHRPGGRRRPRRSGSRLCT